VFSKELSNVSRNICPQNLEKSEQKERQKAFVTSLSLLQTLSKNLLGFHLYGERCKLLTKQSGEVVVKGLRKRSRHLWWIA
jgi:hypothetical protein